MSGDVIADAGPLIALARIGELHLLRELYGKVLVPPRVMTELRLAEDRPGSRNLRQTVAEGWLQEVDVTEEGQGVVDNLDPGEAQAVALARQRKLRFLLIDEQRGRRVARRYGLTIAGTGAILLAAKRRGLLEVLAPVLERLTQAGYRLSADLRRELLRLAGE